jgi:hypothetical protein
MTSAAFVRTPLMVSVERAMSLETSVRYVSVKEGDSPKLVSDALLVWTTMRFLTVFGVCSHIFHMHCIIRWTEKMQPEPLCPLCKRKWGKFGAELLGGGVRTDTCALSAQIEEINASDTGAVVKGDATQDMQENVFAGGEGSSEIGSET